VSAPRKNLIQTFLLCFLLSLPSTSQAKTTTISANPIEHFLPEDPEQTSFNKLEFLGGLELTSKDKNFGGFSGLRLSKDGKVLYAVSDQGHFLKAGIIRNSEGKISALKNAKFSRLRNRKGKRISGKKNGDAEALEIFGTQFLIGFERNHRVDFFNQKNAKLWADERADPVGLKGYDFPNNKGPEAIAISPLTQELFVFAEYAPNEDNHHQGLIIKGSKVEPLAVTLTAGYSLTDAHFLADGDLLILERFYTPITGQAMRIRKFESTELKANAVISGEIIMEAASQMEIDNMEGLAITKAQDGSTRLTLISDDNFSRNQRTILLEFKLID
jgi:hypothetical protein